MMSSTNTTNNNATHLAQLKREYNAVKNTHDIDSCTELWQRMAIADERRPLLDEIEKYELLVEAHRVEDAVQKFEKCHPPTTNDCKLCHGFIKLGDWKKASFTSRGEPCKVLHCCAGIICNKCFDAITKKKEDTDADADVEGGDEKEISCPLCHDALLPTEEMKSQLIKNAKDGHAESQVTLGICLLGPGFLFGGPYPCGGFELDQREGLKWIRLAAEQNHPMALFILGRAHYEGIGVLDKSPSDAFRFLEQAATLGSSWAHELLGEMYMAGHGVDRDEQKGAKHLTIAYGLGVCLRSSLKLGVIYYGGLGGLDRNLVLAKHYLEEASMTHVVEDAYAPLGNTLFELNLEQYDGTIHIPGHSCIPKSIYWLRRAANDNGDEDAGRKARGLEECIQNYCHGCLRTAIGAPREPGIEQCPGKLQRCNRCKAAWYCGKSCQKIHWKRGHKVDCIDPKVFSEKFNSVDSLNEAIRATVPPEQYEETRRKFTEALAQAMQEVGPPPR